MDNIRYARDVQQNFVQLQATANQQYNYECKWKPFIRKFLSCSNKSRNKKKIDII